MDPELKRLHHKRGLCKSTITRIDNFIRDPVNIAHCTVDTLEARKQKLIDTLKEYESVQLDILSLDADDQEDVGLIEDKYFSVLGQVNAAIRQLTVPNTNAKSADAACRLPNIDISSFDGKDFTKFKPFIDLFDAVIDKNLSLSNVQKLFYLRKYLVGDALSVIINLPLVNESYPEAIKLLKKRFDNRARIISNHINMLLDMPQMQKGTAASIRSFISDITQQLYALKNLEQPVETWDMLLISILSRKLDSYTNRAYHLDRSYPDDLPTMEEFLSFLEKRAIALEDSSPFKNTCYEEVSEGMEPKAEVGYELKKKPVFRRKESDLDLPPEGDVFALKNIKGIKVAAGKETGTSVRVPSTLTKPDKDASQVTREASVVNIATDPEYLLTYDTEKYRRHRVAHDRRVFGARRQLLYQVQQRIDDPYGICEPNIGAEDAGTGPQQLNFELEPKPAVFGYYKHYWRDGGMGPGLGDQMCTDWDLPSGTVGVTTAATTALHTEEMKSEESILYVDTKMARILDRLRDDLAPVRKKNDDGSKSDDESDDGKTQPTPRLRTPLRDMVLSSSSSNEEVEPRWFPRALPAPDTDGAQPSCSYAATPEIVKQDIVLEYPEGPAIELGSSHAMVRSKHAFLEIPQFDENAETCSRTLATVSSGVASHARLLFGSQSHLYLMQATTSPYGFHGPPAAAGTEQSAQDVNDDESVRMKTPPPCICRPGFPPLGICSHPQIATDVEEEETNYCKMLLVWIGFFAKVFVFGAIWGTLMYFFAATGGFVNVVPTPILLSKDLNTYIDVNDAYKVLMINNSQPSNTIRIVLDGPFLPRPTIKIFQNSTTNRTELGRNLQWQYERFYYNKSDFNIVDPDRIKTEDVEVPHRSAYAYTTYSEWKARKKWTTDSEIAKKWYLADKKTDWETRWSKWKREHEIDNFTSTFCVVHNDSMVSNGIGKYTNFVPYGDTLAVTVSFADYRRGGIPARSVWWHRHIANRTNDANLSVTYGWRYGLFWDIDEPKTVAFTVRIEEGIDPELTTTTTTPPPPNVVDDMTGLMYAGGLVGVLLLLILLQTHRTLLPIMLAVATLSVLAYHKVRPDYEEMCRWLDMDYVMRIFFVMLLISVTTETGLYDVIAVVIAKVATSFWKLMIILCLATYIMTMFLENTMVMLHLTPIGIRTCEELRVNPKPVLIVMGMYANLASIQTCNSYPNIDLWQKWTWVSSAYAQQSFYWNMFPGAMLCQFVTVVYLVLVFRFTKPHRYENPGLAELEHEQLLWLQLSAEVYGGSQGATHVRDSMMSQYYELESQKLRGLYNDPTGDEEDDFRSLRDKVLLLKVAVSLVIVYILLSFKDDNTFGFGAATDGLIAMVGCAMLLILVNPPDLNYLLLRMEWSTIFTMLAYSFFRNGLVLLQLEHNIKKFLIRQFPFSVNAAVKSKNIKKATLSILGVSAMLSALISNIASSEMLFKTIRNLSDAINDKVYDRYTSQSMAWALSFGGNLGGTLTALSSGPSIAYLTAAGQQGYQITLWEHFKFAAPLVTMELGAVALYYYVKA